MSLKSWNQPKEKLSPGSDWVSRTCGLIESRSEPLDGSMSSLHRFFASGGFEHLRHGASAGSLWTKSNGRSCWFCYVRFGRLRHGRTNANPSFLGFFLFFRSALKQGFLKETGRWGHPVRFHISRATTSITRVIPGGFIRCEFNPSNETDRGLIRQDHFWEIVLFPHPTHLLPFHWKSCPLVDLNKVVSWGPAIACVCFVGDPSFGWFSKRSRIERSHFRAPYPILRPTGTLRTPLKRGCCFKHFGLRTPFCFCFFLLGRFGVHPRFSMARFGAPAPFSARVLRWASRPTAGRSSRRRSF